MIFTKMFRSDSTGAGSLEGVDHDQQFHDRLVHRPRSRLNEEDVLFAGVVDDLYEDVLVGEFENVCATEIRPQVAADVPRQLRVGVPGVDVELVRYWQSCLQGLSIDHCRRSDGLEHHLGFGPSGVGVMPTISLSAKPSCCASPARNAAIPTTLSPAFRRMTITPRAPDE